MAVIYGTQHVDERYASIFEPNLYYNSFLVPGATCTNKYTQKAGGIYVHKLSGVAPVEPGTPGRDFAHTNSADELIQIVLNNNYQKSRKLYDVQMESIDAPIAEENLRTATEEVREGRELSAIGALITEGTASADKTAITADNVKNIILSERAALSKAKGRANVILASPDVYAAILTGAGREFVPSRNERIQMNGQVGEWFGFTIFECNALAHGAPINYYDFAGTKKTVTAATANAVDFIMYYSEAFSVVDNLSKYKMEDGGVIFNGVAAQVEVNTGFRLTNSALARVKSHTAG
jgi:hypothetical protein